MKRTLMIAGLVVAIALIVAMAFVQFNQTALADEMGVDGDGMDMDLVEEIEIEGQIHVTGQAVAFVPSDMATISLGVEAMSTSSVSDAHSRANMAMTAMKAALASSSVDTTTDIQTTHFNISPEYDWTDDGRMMIGYTARHNISVKIRDLDNVAAAIDSAITAGGNYARFHGLDFSAEKSDEVMSELREAAFENAFEQAEHFADLAGLEIAGVVSISAGFDNYLPVPYFAESAMLDRASTPISAGEKEVSMSVDVTFLTVAADISATPEPLDDDTGTPESGGS